MKNIPNTWLVKTEPETYHITQLERDRKTMWNGVRNFLARNYLTQMKSGDLVLIYHSGKDKAVVGLSEVSGSPHIEPIKDPLKDASKDKKGWFEVELKYRETFLNKVTLKLIKETLRLNQLLLIKQSRLSVMPITRSEFDELVRLGNH